jgi:hypothetical protein
MDRQTGSRTYEIVLSDDSMIEVEICFSVSTDNENSIANQQIEAATVTSILDPMQMLMSAVLYDDDESDDEQTEASSEESDDEQTEANEADIDGEIDLLLEEQT